MFTVIGLMLTTLGCVCVYLASPNQRWLVAAWPARLALSGGALLSLIGGLSLARAMSVVTAAFTWLTALMLVCSILPYVGVVLGARRRG